MGRVNISGPYPDRTRPWRAQWTERAADQKRKSCSKWFPSEEQATEFKVEHEAEGAAFGELAMSAPMKARWWTINEQCRAAGVAVEDAVAAGIKALAARVRRSEEIGTALDLWALDARRRKLRPVTISGMKRAVKILSKGREATPVGDFAGSDLLVVLEARYADDESREIVRGRLVTFFNWCAAPPRGWCDAKQIAEAKWPHAPRGDKKRIGFYTADETAALLAALPDNLKVAVATDFFAGLRPEETQRTVVSWEDGGEFYGFDEKKGEWHIAPQWAKTRAYRRLYDLPDCWWYWWIKYRAAMKPRVVRRHQKPGKIVPVNYRNFRHALRAARAKAGIKRSPKDVIRHSFASHGYHRAADGSRGVEWTIDLMGHVTGYGLFVKHYKGAVSQAEAEAYFLIYPEGAACAWRKGMRAPERIIAGA